MGIRGSSLCVFLLFPGEGVEWSCTDPKFKKKYIICGGGVGGVLHTGVTIRGGLRLFQLFFIPGVERGSWWCLLNVFFGGVPWITVIAGVQFQLGGYRIL